MNPENKLASKYTHEISIEGSPVQLLKTIQSLKKMGQTSTCFELSFSSIKQIDLFTHILNREEDEQRVANELRMTFFHNVRGKIKRTQINKNQQFSTVKKIRFNSPYHVTLFYKFYQDRIKQLENEFKYIMSAGKDGFLHVYIGHDEQISSMFINEITEKKRKLQFFEIKDPDLCEKFVYSDRMGQELQKIGIFHEIWYRGKQSTIIFYAEKQTLSDMKRQVINISKYHITVVKMVDDKFPFLLNYLLFCLLRRFFTPQINKLEFVDMHQVQFNQNKLAIIIHDKHEIFSKEIVDQILQRMKNFVLLTVKAKNARQFSNFLKKNFNLYEFITFSYSKKNVCMCINLSKVKSFEKVKELLGRSAESLDQESQITFNWFHLQGLTEFRKGLVERISSIVSYSVFHVENFQKFLQNKSLKCVLKLKNINKNVSVLSENVGELLFRIVRAWSGEILPKVIEKVSSSSEDFELDRKIVSEDNLSDQSNSSDQSQYESDHETVQFEKEQSNLQNQEISQISLKQENNFTRYLREYAKQNDPKFYQSLTDCNDELKEGKPWRKAEEELQKSTNILARIKRICFSDKFVTKMSEIHEKYLILRDDFSIRLHPFDSYSLKMYQSSFCRSSPQKGISSFEELSVGSKFMICLQHNQDKSRVCYPFCSIEILPTI